MNLTNEQLQDIGTVTQGAIYATDVDDLIRDMAAELLAARERIGELERQLEAAHKTCFAAGYRIGGMEDTIKALENDVANATMNLEHVEQDNAALREQNNRAGWARVTVPPEFDKPYLLTNGRDVIPAMYQRVSYPLGDHMEWVSNGCIDTHGVTRTATHYREIELPKPPEV